VNGETGNISISGFSGSHNDLTDIGSSDHHTRYSDSEAVSAVESANPLSLNNAIELHGTDGNSYKLFVGPDEPTNPSVGDIWIDNWEAFE